MRKTTEKKQQKTLDFLPVEETRMTLSVKVKEQVYRAVDLERQQQGLTWVDLQEAMMRKFLDEQGISLLELKIEKAKS